LLMLVVDCHTAWSTSTPDEDSGDAEPATPAASLTDTYPQREITVHLGTGYVVDKALIRDDYLSGLISQREALRQRGYTDEQIDDIENEQAEERDVRSPAQLGETQPFAGAATQAGRTVGTAQRQEPNRNGEPVGGAL